uniref:Uncharacterized protein n=1 Tax=Apteryx owenii TaxID=8824 RepID=A0A8B9NWC9_APTOW
GPVAFPAGVKGEITPTAIQKMLDETILFSQMLHMNLKDICLYMLCYIHGSYVYSYALLTYVHFPSLLLLGDHLPLYSNNSCYLFLKE